MIYLSSLKRSFSTWMRKLMKRSFYSKKMNLLHSDPNNERIQNIGVYNEQIYLPNFWCVGCMHSILWDNYCNVGDMPFPTCFLQGIFQSPHRMIHKVHLDLNAFKYEQIFSDKRIYIFVLFFNNTCHWFFDQFFFFHKSSYKKKKWKNYKKNKKDEWKNWII